MSFLGIGFRFNPTRQELLLYLQRKVAGLSLLPSYINGIFQNRDDVYGTNEPWNLFNVEDNITDPFFYAFTTLKGLSDNSKRINRRAGSGTWSGRTAAVDVKDFDGDVIGFDRYYVFEVKGGDHRKWTMHEFCLNERQSPGDVVMCVIGCDTTISIRDFPKSSVAFAKHFEGDRGVESLKRKLMEESEDDDDEEKQNPRKRNRFSFVAADAPSDQFLYDDFGFPLCDSLDAYYESSIGSIPISAAAEEEIQQQFDPFHAETHPFFSDYALFDYDPTAANLFTDQCLSIPDEIGVLESSMTRFEEPAIPFFPSCDSPGAYYPITVQPLSVISAVAPAVAEKRRWQLNERPWEETEKSTTEKNWHSSKVE